MKSNILKMYAVLQHIKCMMILKLCTPYCYITAMIFRVYHGVRMFFRVYFENLILIT